ncbi:MAG: RNase adapter RapZ [Clostridia bacterium]
MEFLIVTGMSGAGKATTQKYLEDMGYYCIDNMPPALMPKFAALCIEGNVVEKPAMIVDIRGKDFLTELMPSLDMLSKSGISHRMIFLDASNEAIVKRFKENRRAHPLSQGGRILDDIISEREQISGIKEIADIVIDTSEMNATQLNDELSRVLNNKKTTELFTVSVVSFGFKYGTPIDCDLVFDVRFIPNPFYVSDMKHLSGLDQQVKDYVMGFDETKEFLKKLNEMIRFLLPLYIREGKAQLSIGVGCTGGRHRSVAIGEELYLELKSSGNMTSIQHRDIDKDGRGVSK